MVYGFNKLKNNNFVVHNSHADSYKTTQTSRTATIPLKPVGIRGIETTPEVIEKAPWHSEDLQVERHSPKHHRLGLPSLAPPCSIALKMLLSHTALKDLNLNIHSNGETPRKRRHTVNSKEI
jgi:hypothetical protein